MLDLARDESLCSCVLAVEFPSLDCRDPFLRWSLDRHSESCQDAETRKQSLSFCSCVETVYDRVVTAENAEDEDETRQQIARTANCIELPDAFPLPDLESLASAS